MVSQMKKAGAAKKLSIFKALSQEMGFEIMYNTKDCKKR